jgi:hypothetical protein
MSMLLGMVCVSSQGRNFDSGPNYVSIKNTLEFS